MCPTIIVADDDPSGRYFLKSVFSSAGYATVLVEDGVQALEAARSEPPDVIIADVLMPHMDGYQLVREWRADERLRSIPFVFYTANYTEADDEAFALSLGVDRFLLKPMDPIDVLREVDRLLTLTKDGEYSVRAPKTDSESAVLKEYNARLVNKLERQLEDLHRANESLHLMVNGTVRAIAKLAEARDPYTSGHQERVAEIAQAIAREMGHDEHYCEGIRIAGLIHDIGKINVPAEILTKPRALTDLEYAIIKTHPQVAFDVLSGIAFPWPIAQYVLQHHERLDGSGYPQGLHGTDILAGACILSIADVVEAMSAPRPYKPAAGIEAALDEIEKNAGRLYHLAAADACLTLFRERGFLMPTAD